MVLVASMVFLLAARESGAAPGEPSVEALRSMVEGYARAIEINNRELALWHVHPRSPNRDEIDASLRDQLASYLERARTSNLEITENSGGTISATLQQEIVQVFGMKFLHNTRRSIYKFRESGGTWWIWAIDAIGDEKADCDEVDMGS